MKAAYSAPAWGWTPHPATRAPMPWLAEITGTHPTYRYQRRFVVRRVEHQGARDGVSTEVACWWTLESGHLYQCRHLIGRRGGWTTRWITVTDDGDVIDLTEEEAAQWLNACSASTS